MTDADILLALGAQQAMADTLASQANTLSGISETLTNISVNQARMEERIIIILEDNKGRDSEISQLRARVNKLDNLVTLNKFVLNFYPQILWLVGTAFLAGGGAIYTFTELIK